MSAPLRIALVTPEHPDCGPSFGVGAYVSALAGALADAGHEVLLLVVGAGGWWTACPGRPAQRWHGAAPAALRPALAAPWLRARLAAFSPDLVEYANWGGLGACDHGPWRRVVRLSTPVLEIPAADAWRAALRPLHHLWELRTVRRAHLVIANSQAMAALALTCYGRAADVVIPHAHAGPLEAPVTAGEDVLFVGRLEPRKGVDVLLDAWRAVQRLRPQAHLHLVGAGHSAWAARVLARTDQDGLTIHGHLADTILAGLRRRCRIQVVPSRFESFGLVALEAWAGGQALVASAVGGLPEIVGDAGVLVPPEDATELAAALALLLGDRPRCSTLALRGQARLTERFGSANWVASTLAAYRQAGRRPCEPA